MSDNGNPTEETTDPNSDKTKSSNVSNEVEALLKDTEGMTEEEANRYLLNQGIAMNILNNRIELEKDY